MSSRSKTMTWGLPIIGIATLAIGTGLVIDTRPVVKDEFPPRQPSTAPSAASGIDAKDYIGAIGVSEPPGEPIAIATHVGGVIDSVFVSIGQRVNAGDPLLRIDSRTANADLSLRSSEVTVAEAELASLRAEIPPLRAAIITAEAVVAAAEADLLAAQADLADRMNQLSIVTAVEDPRAVSREEVDRRRFAVDQSRARVKSADAAVKRAESDLLESRTVLERYVVENGSDGPVILAASARINQARQMVAQAQTEVDLHTARSPVDARVLQVNARQGEYATAASSTEGLIVLGREGAAHLRVEIDEVDISRFSRSAAAWASPRGDAATRIRLNIVDVEPLIVPKRNLAGRTDELIDTRVLQVIYALDPSFQTIGVGQQFDVYIEVGGSGS